jgi:short-subunit dehydrogenase
MWEFGPMQVKKLHSDKDLSGTIRKDIQPARKMAACSKIEVDLGMSEALSRELMLFGIDVIIISPGLVSLSFVDNLQNEDISPYWNTPYRESTAKVGPMMANKKALPPERIAESVQHALTTPKPKVR